MAESRGRILNVDDYVPARYARSEALRRAGYEVIESGTGVDTLRVVAEERPDLVLLDINLPDLNGFEVCRRIRERLGTATLPIVHISSTFVSERAHELAIEGGSDAYLTEPVEIPVLLATVNALLRLHRAETSLRAAGRRWQATFDALGSGICLLSADGNAVQCNAAFGTLCGRPVAELAGLPWAALWATGESAAGECAIAELPRGAARETTELFRNERWFRLVVDPVLEDGAVAGFVCVATDITIERQAAEARALLFAREQTAREDAEAANRAKDEFLAMLGHELRNPLEVIANAVNVLDMIGGKDARAVRTRQVIRRQVRQLARLVDDLLDVSRVTTGKIGLERRPVDLAEAVRRCADALAGTEQTGRHRLEIDARPVWVQGDRSRIEQVVMNLVSNAIKYTPAGGRISIAVRGDGRTARLSVSDTGLGIPAHMVERIFDLFVQGERTLDRAEGGLGIGLTLVRRLVELHGGRVGASSGGPGRGSTFVVELPEIPTPAASVEAPPSARTSGRRILIVEDNRDTREMLRFSLELAGHEVHDASDGPTGLEMLLKLAPDVALVDVGLPGFDGLELVRRAREARTTTRLVALTGYGLPDDLRRSREAGFDTHLVKPVDPARLGAVIDAAPAQGAGEPTEAGDSPGDGVRGASSA
jgi:PAS domain S-box-containing protein